LLYFRKETKGLRNWLLEIEDSYVHRPDFNGRTHCFGRRTGSEKDFICLDGFGEAFDGAGILGITDDDRNGFSHWSPWGKFQPEDESGTTAAA
jgi:hypothetical protein